MGTLDYLGTHVFYCQAPGIPISKERLLKDLSSRENDSSCARVAPYTKRGGEMCFDTFKYVVQIVQDNSLGEQCSFLSTGNLDRTKLRALEVGRAVREELLQRGVREFSFHLDHMFGA